MLRLVSIAWESMSERRRIQFPRLESKCWTHVWEQLLKLLFCHQLKPGRAFPKHFLNCAGSQWEAEVSNRCEQHKSDHKTNEHTQGLIFLFIPAHSRRKCSETKAELSTEVLREELDIQARAARVCGVFLGWGYVLREEDTGNQLKYPSKEWGAVGSSDGNQTQTAAEHHFQPMAEIPKRILPDPAQEPAILWCWAQRKQQWCFHSRLSHQVKAILDNTF